MSLQILNAQGILSSDLPVGNLLWVDAVNGIDALAVRGRATVPFKTLQAARDAAQSGDTIMVLPGTYNENDLLRNGVNIVILYVDQTGERYTMGVEMSEIPAAAQAVSQCQSRLPSDAEHPAKDQIEAEIGQLEERLAQLKESIGAA